MTTSESFVRFDKVDKSYDGEILVVKDLNLDVPKGEFLTMLGPSGSGKTTVLMMLAGFETPTSGEIYLDGNPISSIPPNKRGIGMVFQNYALFPHMTVKENLAFPLEVRKLPKTEHKLDLLSYEFLHKRNMLFGTPEYVIEKIEELKSELNLQNLQVWSNFPGVKHEHCMRSIKLFTEKVMPHFKSKLNTDIKKVS